MLSTPLFPLPEGLEITSVSDSQEEVLVQKNFVKFAGC